VAFFKKGAENTDQSSFDYGPWLFALLSTKHPGKKAVVVDVTHALNHRQGAPDGLLHESSGLGGGDRAGGSAGEEDGGDSRWLGTPWVKGRRHHEHLV
jgi:hypothetical protein